MVQILVIDRNLEKMDPFRELLLLVFLAQRGGNEVNLHLRKRGKFFQQRFIGRSHSPAKRRKFIVQHQDTHNIFINYVFRITWRTTYMGRRFTSSKMRPTYSPITPIVIN